MAVKAEYKFKPYTPKNLKIATTGLSKDEKLKKSLESQRNNLDARLRAEGIDPGTLGGEFDNRNLIEKALNLKPDQGMLLDIIDVINRPVEAVKAGIVAGVEGRDVVANALEAFTSASAGDTSGAEVVYKLTGFEAQSKVGKFATNLFADIALDPLTYLPAGFFTKPIGKLFRKYKDIPITEFVGSKQALEAIAKAGITDATGQAFKNFDDFTKYIDTLDDVAKADAIAKFDNAVLDTSNRSIFRKGSAEDYASGNYTKSYEGLKERRRVLSETRDEILRIRREVLDPKEADKQIAKLLKDRGLDKFSKKNLSPSALAEIKLADDLDPIIADLGDDFSTMVTRTENRLDDVSIVKKVKVGDQEYYIKVVEMDAKMGGGSYGATKQLKLNDKGKLVFTEGGDNLGGLDATFEADMRKIKIDYTGTNGTKFDNMYDALTDMMKRGSVKGMNTLNPYSLIKPGDTASKQALDNYFSLVNRAKHQNGKGWIYISDVNGKGQGIFARYEDLEKYLDFSKSSFGFQSSGKAKAFIKRNKKGVLSNTSKAKLKPIYKAETGLDNFDDLLDADLDRFIDIYNQTVAGTKTSQFRMSSKLGISDSANIEEMLANTAANKIYTGSDMINAMMEQTGTKRIQISFLDWLEDKQGIIGDLAKITNKFVKSIKAKFSLYGFIPDEVETTIRRMSGETAVAYQTRMRRLAGIQDAFEKQFPGKSKSLYRLAELGASLDDAGNLVLAPRTISAKEYIEYMIGSADNGKPFIVREFANQQAEKKFLNQLDGIYGSQNSFEIVTVNGNKVLKTNLSKAELEEGLQLLQNKALIGQDPNLMLDWGKLDVTPEEMRILKEFQGFNEFVTLKNDVQKLLVQEGGFSEFLGNGLNDTYMRHIMTKEGYEYMSRKTPGALSKFAKPGSNVFEARKYPGTADEVNAYMRAIYNAPVDVIDTNAFRSAEDFFKYAFRNIEQKKMMDILLSSKDKYGRSLLRVVDNTKDVRTALSPDDLMFKSFEEEFPALFKNLSEDSQAGLREYLQRNGLDKTKAVIINRSMHQVLKRVEKAFVDLPSWLKVYDKYLNLWKGLTLVTPGFHMRNLFGNSFNSYAVGMGLPSQLRYARIASLEFKTYDDAVKILANGGKLNKAQQKVYDTMTLFQQSGLIQSHRGVRDLDTVKEGVEEALKKGKGGAVKSTYNNVVRFNFNVAEKMDDMQRYMLWRWSFDKTGDAIKANKTVAASLFDYSNLTSFEKDVMKRLFPFYTFMKNNFIFQAKNIFRNPAQYAKTGRAYKYYLEDIAGYSPEDLPDYATENMWIPIPMMVTKNDKEGIAFLKANLPLTDFVELVENPFKKGAISVTTPVKLAIEIGIGRDLFTGAPISEFPGQTNVMDPGTGVLAGIRDQKGTLAIAQTPLMQKILNDIGLRTPFNVASVGLDIADTLMGYQGPASGLSDFLQRAGIAGVQETKTLSMTSLYQDLEHLRELKKYYEQETGNQLPVLP